MDDREERTWRALQQMQMRIDAELARRLAADSSLSCPEYHVLEALSGHPEGRMRMFELGEALGWEKSRASHQVGRMVERGLVEKTQCPSDRRGSHIAVTERGRRAIEAAEPEYEAAVSRLFSDHLTARQLDALRGAAEAVLAGLVEEPDDEDEQ